MNDFSDPGQVDEADATATDAATALIAANRRRRRVRQWVAIGSVPLVLGAVALSGKILAMYAFAHQSITSYVVDDYEGTIAAAESQEFLNWFEPYKAPFNVGVGLAASLQLPEARAKFEESLTLATGLEVCSVRVNLAIVLEQMGDAARDAGDPATANELYAEGLTVTLETPKDCDSSEAQSQSSDPERKMDETLDGLEDRLQEKQQQSQQEQQEPPAEEPEEPQEQPQPSEDKLDDLEEQLDQGQQEREQRQQGEGDEPGSGTDRPW